MSHQIPDIIYCPMEIDNFLRCLRINTIIIPYDDQLDRLALKLYIDVKDALRFIDESSILISVRGFKLSRNSLITELPDNQLILVKPTRYMSEYIAEVSILTSADPNVTEYLINTLKSMNIELSWL